MIEQQTKHCSHYLRVAFFSHSEPEIPREPRIPVHRTKVTAISTLHIQSKTLIFRYLKEISEGEWFPDTECDKKE